jgi:hypothetical protein
MAASGRQAHSSMHQNRITVALITSVMAMVASCTTTTTPNTVPSDTFDWLSQFKYSAKKCTDIRGHFQNLGEKRILSGEVTRDGLLVENVLSQHLPRGNIADSVELESNIRNGLLGATLIGDVSRKAGFAVSCQSGWQVFSFTTTGQYLGEGTDLVRYQQVNYLRQDRSGALLARVLTSTQTRTVDRSGSEESGQKWYRFEPVPNSE